MKNQLNNRELPKLSKIQEMAMAKSLISTLFIVEAYIQDPEHFKKLAKDTGFTSAEELLIFFICEVNK